MSYKTEKNLISESSYNRYYSDFRGVDFSSDHTLVNKNRLAYLVNMYKDYSSGQGQALETVAGFRKRFVAPVETVDGINVAEVYGLFNFRHRNSNGQIVTKVIVHAGSRLWLWNNYPHSVNISLSKAIEANGEATQVLGFEVDSVESLVNTQTGASIVYSYNKANNTLTYTGETPPEEDTTLTITYKEGVISGSDTPLYTGMNKRKSSSFVFNNKLYIIDGVNYLVYDGTTISPVSNVAYVPTTYINIIPTGANANTGVEYEQRNLLTPKFKNTFIADGTNLEFCVNENNLDSVDVVKVYGVTKTVGVDYTVDLQNGKITFTTAPTTPQSTIQTAANAETGTNAIYYPEMYAGVEITASKTIKQVSGVAEKSNALNALSIIENCTLSAIFDGRIFLSGNESYPNHIFYANRNLTGFIDASYFGILNYVQDGVGHSPIMNMMAVSDTLMVLKGDTQQDSSVYFHTPTDISNNLQPRIYPSTQGLAGLGCVGGCINFLDDPVFISRLGLEAVSQLSVRLERAIEHRSSLIDAKLVNEQLNNATIDEWGGYLIICVDGKMYLADSRQAYASETGIKQYEWYYLEGIGVYEGQYLEYFYADKLVTELTGLTVGDDLPLELAPEELRGKIVNPPNEYDGKNTLNELYNDAGISREIKLVNIPTGVDSTGDDTSIQTYVEINYVVKDGKAYLCKSYGNFTGGVFKQATITKSMDDNLFFGTLNGVVCSFNFDKRDSDGVIPIASYDFDGRTIFSGCATCMDNCDIPHLTKSTIKKSEVIKTKTYQKSAIKIKVRTNKTVWNQIARLNNSVFGFNDLDFEEFTFSTTDQSLYSVREKEKQWVEKQYYFFSDEYRRPFALYYVAYRYKIAGRYKG